MDTAELEKILGPAESELIAGRVSISWRVERNGLRLILRWVPLSMSAKIIISHLGSGNILFEGDLNWAGKYRTLDDDYGVELYSGFQSPGRPDEFKEALVVRLIVEPEILLQLIPL